MTVDRCGTQDPLEREIEHVLNPGEFIPDGECFSFVSSLDATATKAAALAKTDPDRAAVVYETFLAGCYAKVEELDDSSGSFGQFVCDLFCGWIEARQAGLANPDDTVDRLLAWTDDDLYALSYGVEKDAVKVFDEVGLAAFERRIRERFEAAGGEADSLGRPDMKAQSARRQWSAVLRTVYLAQRDVMAYVAVAEQTGLTAVDCHNVATLLVRRRKPADALAWVDRGLEVEKGESHASEAGLDLAKLRRELWATLGRGDEALAAAWADFRDHPSMYTYDAALLNFDRARRCFERAGLGEEWEKTIADVRARHRRKLGFISDFERLVAGSPPRPQESFLERAKARWVARPAKREA